MVSYKSRIAASLTSAKIQLAEVFYNNNQIELLFVDEEYFSDYLNFSHPETKILSELKRVFNEILLRGKINSNLISFSLSDSFFKVLRLPIDSTLLEDDLREIIKEEIKIVYPMFKNKDFIFQYAIVKKKDLFKNDFALVFVVDKQIVEIIKELCSHYNFELKFIDISHYSANILLKAYEDLCKDKYYLTFYYQDNFLSLNILFDNKPAYYSAIYYENIIALPDKVKEAIELFKLDLNENLNIYKAYISGENIPDSLSFQIGKIIGKEPEKINPFAKMKISEKISGKIIVDKGCDFASCVGLALRIL